MFHLGQDVLCWSMTDYEVFGEMFKHAVALHFAHDRYGWTVKLLILRVLSDVEKG